MIFVEAIPQVFGFLTPATGFVSELNGSFLFGVISAGHGTALAQVLIVVQLFAGSYLVFLMDEVVSKWGIGSGISLFIFFFSGRRRHTRSTRDWSSDVCSSDLEAKTRSRLARSGLCLAHTQARTVRARPHAQSRRPDHGGPVDCVSCAGSLPHRGVGLCREIRRASCRGSGVMSGGWGAVECESD